MELLLTLADHCSVLRMPRYQTMLDEDARVDETEWAADPQDLGAERVEDAGLEGPMGAGDLAEEGAAEAAFFFGQEAQGLPCRTEDAVAVGLLEADEQVHHL